MRGKGATVQQYIAIAISAFVCVCVHWIWDVHIKRWGGDAGFLVMVCLFPSNIVVPTED